MNKNFTEFVSVIGGTSAVLALPLGAMGFLKGSAWIEANGVLLFVNGIYLYSIPLIIWVTVKINKKPNFISPKVRKVISSEILLIDKCEWMGLRMSVTIFQIDDDVERFFGTATVLNIQENGYIQLKLHAFGSEPIDITRISDLKHNLKIKPGVET